MKKVRSVLKPERSWSTFWARSGFWERSGFSKVLKRKSIMASEHTIVGDNLLLDQTTQSLFQQVFTTGKEIEPKQNVFTQ